MRYSVLLALLCAAVCTSLPAAEREFDYGPPFGRIALYMPEGRPRSMVLFLSGDGGWHLGVVRMARAFTAAGVAVAGLDVRHYLADITAHPGSCRYMAADFETLAHRVQRELHLNDYQLPLLYGYSSGATVAYAVLVQSPPGTFGGAVSLGFCPDQKFGGVPLCPGPGAQLSYRPGPKDSFVFDPAARLGDRWIAFQGQNDQTCPLAAVDEFARQVGSSTVIRLAGVGHGFGVEDRWLPQLVATLDTLAPRVQPGALTSVDDLPLIEQPATHGAADLPIALLLTGDGGWAGLDRGMAAELGARGLPVVGLSTLRYYWKARTPEESARDIARVITHYLALWKRQRVLLIGYSFGANVLPFIVNRLPPELRARIAGVGLLGLDDYTSFEIKVAGWLPGSSSGELPVRPEIEKMTGLRALCLYGGGEQHDPCAALAGPNLRALQIGTGHHFSGAYAQLADAVLQGSGISAPGTNATQ
ncbi:MAG: AcvB/VirJ family lysyl-phosphatidylglycerol hydrolase [Steroidobacteraceae bacterium]